MKLHLHELTEFIKINRPVAILIQLGDNILNESRIGIQILRKPLPQLLRSQCLIIIAIIDIKCGFEVPRNEIRFLVHVGQEELREIDTPVSVDVDSLEQLFSHQFGLAGTHEMRKGLDKFFRL